MSVTKHTLHLEHAGRKYDITFLNEHHKERFAVDYVLKTHTESDNKLFLRSVMEGEQSVKYQILECRVTGTLV